MRNNGDLPAFPTHTKEGLTKREWLIGMIAAGLCANPEYSTVAVELVARDSELQADAILSSLETVSEQEVHIDV